MDQKKRFIGDYYRQFVTFSELCARYGVSRRVGYQWLARFELDGPPGLADRSRRPHHSPTATALPVVEQLLTLRRSHPSWGGRLNEVGDGLGAVYFGPVLLGRMDERKLRIEDHRGRWIRKQVLPMSPD